MSEKHGVTSLGVMMMTATAVSFSLMALFVRLAAESTPVAVIILVRYGIGTLLFGILAAFGNISLRPVNCKLLTWRAIGAALGGVFYFYALADITIAEAVFLKFTYPLFAVTIAAIMFGEKTGKLVQALMLMGIAGVAVMMNPFGFNPQPGYMWGILNGLTAGISVAVVRKLRETDNSGAIVFYTSLAGVIFSLPILLKGVSFPSDLTGYIYLGLTALFGLMAQFTLVFGFKYIPTGAATVVMMGEVALTALFGYFLLGQAISVNELAGGAMILFGGGVLLSRVRTTDKNG
jgi:drug/metabolite transporter (DMT)-like permease